MTCVMCPPTCLKASEILNLYSFRQSFVIPVAVHKWRWLGVATVPILQTDVTQTKFSTSSILTFRQRILLNQLNCMFSMNFQTIQPSQMVWRHVSLAEWL